MQLHKTMASVDGDVHKSLWESMKAVTRRRLEFDHKMRERATNSVGPPGMSAFSPDVGGGGALASNAVDSVHNDNWQKSDGILSIEGRVTYIKFQADQLLHLAEVSRLTCGTNEYRSWFSPDACDDSGLASRALKAYTSALRAASGGDQTRNNQHSSDDNCGDNAAGNALKNKGSEDTDAASVVPTLPELHPLRLELVWRTSFILFHFLDRPLEAWEAAYPTYVAAAERPARLGPRALIIAQLLRDHLATIEIQCGEGERLQNWGEGCGLDDRGGRRSSSHDEGWSFLRMATTSESEDELPGMGGDAKSRVIAQVLHARACMEGVAKVLLGTMAGADRVFSALERVRLSSIATATHFYYFFLNRSVNNAWYVVYGESRSVKVWDYGVVLTGAVSVMSFLHKEIMCVDGIAHSPCPPNIFSCSRSPR